MAGGYGTGRISCGIHAATVAYHIPCPRPFDMFDMRKDNPMRVLILGGTQFLGRHLAASALAQGHSVTLFNRGTKSAGLFPEAEHLRGDRDGDLTALHGRAWDVAIDTSGYVPRVARASAELLANAVEHYTFVSSISVYAGWPEAPHIDETAPVGTLADPTVEV